MDSQSLQFISAIREGWHKECACGTVLPHEMRARFSEPRSGMFCCFLKAKSMDEFGNKLATSTCLFSAACGFPGTFRPFTAGLSTQSGASQLAAWVNTTFDAIESASWNPTSARNAAHHDVLDVLRSCPAHDWGLMFALFADIEPDLFLDYGFAMMAKMARNRCTLRRPSLLDQVPP